MTYFRFLFLSLVLFLSGPLTGYEVWVSSFYFGVDIIDSETNEVIDTIPFPNVNIGAIAFTPNGATAYLSNSTDGVLLGVDTTTRTIISTITVGDYPYGIGIAPVISRDGRFGYIANAFNDNVSVIDFSTNSVVATITVGAFPYYLGINPAGDLVGQGIVSATTE